MMNKKDKKPVAVLENDDAARAAALEKARELRAERKGVKAAMKSGEVSAADAAAMPVMSRVRVHEFLRACPGIGPARADAVMVSAGIPSFRRVGGLGPRQLEALLAAVAR